MPLSQGQLDHVRRLALAEAGRRAPRKTMADGDGRVIRSIPFSAYHNAVRVHGESPRDESYWNDMERRYPEIVVPVTGKTRVSMAGMQPPPVMGMAGMRRARTGDCGANLVRTRLGRARRYYYG
jgi:hypothetical protein